MPTQQTPSETPVEHLYNHPVSGENRPPRTPMGTEPLLGSAGGGGCAKSGSRRHTQTILPSFGPHGCVKPYCCLSDCIGFLLESARCYSMLGAGREWVPSGFLSLYVRMGLLLYAQG